MEPEQGNLPIDLSKKDPVHGTCRLGYLIIITQPQHIIIMDKARPKGYYIYLFRICDLSD